MKIFIAAVILFLSHQSFAARPLVVLLHGCKQTAQDIVELTEFDQAAKKYNFMLYTPQQSLVMNPYGCWNWFSPTNQERGQMSEIGFIVRQIQKIQAKHEIEAQRIYVVGFSAGAGLSLNLLYCFPEVFAGAAVHSGPVYGVANDGVSAKTVMGYASGLSQAELQKRALACSQSSDAEFKKKKLLIFQGDGDEVVNFQNAQEIQMQFPGKARVRLFNGLGHQWENTATETIVRELGLAK